MRSVSSQGFGRTGEIFRGYSCICYFFLLFIQHNLQATAGATRQADCGVKIFAGLHLFNLLGQRDSRCACVSAVVCCVIAEQLVGGAVEQCGVLMPHTALLCAIDSGGCFLWGAGAAASGSDDEGEKQGGITHMDRSLLRRHMHRHIAQRLLFCPP